MADLFERVRSNGQDDSPEATSSLVSRNVSVLGHRTSVRLEPEMWQAIKEISDREKCSVHEICSLIALRKRRQTTLTAAIRVFIMLYFWAAVTEEGHQKAGHGGLRQVIERVGLPGRHHDAAA